MHIEDAALSAVITQLAKRDLAQLDLRAALGAVTAAMPALFSADGAGILLLDEDHVLRYVTSTDPDARLLEAAQATTGRGPCVQSLIDNTVVIVPDLATDDRWPDLAEILVPNGVRAVLGQPIRLAGAAVGSFNIYRRAPHTWDDSDREALAAFDRIAERVIAAAVASERNEELVRQLQHALEARVEIERAVGVVMAIAELDAAGAFERIRRSARTSRRPLHEVATEITTTRKLP